MHSIPNDTRHEEDDENAKMAQEKLDSLQSTIEVPTAFALKAPRGF